MKREHRRFYSYQSLYGQQFAGIGTPIPMPVDPFPPSVTLKKFLSKKYCAALVAGYEERLKRDKQNVSGNDGDLFRADIVYEEQPELYEQLGQALSEINQDNYGFALNGFAEAIRVNRYQLGHFNDWHTDYNVYDRSKLGFSALLTDIYTGGDLEFMLVPQADKLKVGDLVAFPGFIVHRVTPILSGVRWSLTGWVAGPAFR